MSLFGKRGPADVVPRDVLDLLEVYGRAAFEARLRGSKVTDPRFGWPNFLGKVSVVYQAHPDRTIAEIHAATANNPFARFGGYRAIVEVGPGTSRDPLFLELMDAGITMIWERNLSSGNLNRYEADRWIELHGDLRSTFDHIVDV
jgi:hypothetical protein